jgi:hypothetical protein
MWCPFGVAVRKGNRSGDCTAYFTPRSNPPRAATRIFAGTVICRTGTAGLLPARQLRELIRAGRVLLHSDAGMTGVAGDGKTIICENSNGLRWEPT